MSLLKSGFCNNWTEANLLSADEVFNMIEFEEISADIEHYNMEQAKNGGGG